MQAVVTGAAGFIGSHLAERLLARGDAVRGIDRFSPSYDPALKRHNAAALAGYQGFELIEGDLNDLELARVVADAEVIFHLAAQPGVRVSWGADFDIYLSDNVLATQRLLEAARACEVPRVVLASSSSVYGNSERYPVSEDDALHPRSPYGASKVAVEHLGRAYWSEFGVPALTLRYFTIFGPRQRPDMAFSRFISAGLSGELVEVYGDGLQRRDFTFVGDAVDATVAAAERGEPGHSYNIAGGVDASVLDVLAILERLLGRRIDVRHLPAAPGDVRITSADTSRARSALGFEPSVTIETGLERQVAAMGEFERT
jgi:UDP-glucuronate 4-epimerase